MHARQARLCLQPSLALGGGARRRVHQTRRDPCPIRLTRRPPHPHAPGTQRPAAGDDHRRPGTRRPRHRKVNTTLRSRRPARHTHRRSGTQPAAAVSAHPNAYCTRRANSCSGITRVTVKRPRRGARGQFANAWGAGRGSPPPGVSRARPEAARPRPAPARQPESTRTDPASLRQHEVAITTAEAGSRANLGRGAALASGVPTAASRAFGGEASEPAAHVVRPPGVRCAPAGTGHGSPPPGECKSLVRGLRPTRRPLVAEALARPAAARRRKHRPGLEFR